MNTNYNVGYNFQNAAAPVVQVQNVGSSNETNSCLTFRMWPECGTTPISSLYSISYAVTISPAFSPTQTSYQLIMPNASATAPVLSTTGFTLWYLSFFNTMTNVCTVSTVMNGTQYFLTVSSQLTTDAPGNKGPFPFVLSAVTASPSASVSSSWYLNTCIGVNPGSTFAVCSTNPPFASPSPNCTVACPPPCPPPATTATTPATTACLGQTLYLNTGWFNSGGPLNYTNQSTTVVNNSNVASTSAGSYVTANTTTNVSSIGTPYIVLQANSVSPAVYSWYGFAGAAPGEVGYLMTPSPSYIGYWLCAGTPPSNVLSGNMNRQYLVDFGTISNGLSWGTSFNFNYTFPTIPNVFAIASNNSGNGYAVAVQNVTTTGATIATSKTNNCGQNVPQGWMWLAISPSFGATTQWYNYSVDAGDFGAGESPVDFNFTFNNPPVVFICAQQAYSPGSCAGINNVTTTSFTYNLNPPSTQARASYIAVGRC